MKTIDKKPREIFLAAIRLPEEFRGPFLDQVCGADTDLRVRVAALLQAHFSAGSVASDVDSRESARVIAPPVTDPLGTMIGPYKLREVLGEGGMGIVYVAEQEKPIRRKVALKIVKPGMDSKEVIARFEAERQALALMDHPNIAKVHDAGTTETGRPYFVMELVRGMPITEYCDERRLPPRERLKLFITVCQAIQHAHQRGIIHRDLKPSNVMITLHDGVPVPKVIDFGVAKALNQRLTEHTLYTRNAQMIGTPLYMSPEQAELSGLDVDPRSDVYSLGVLLYELLTGHTPFDKETFSKVGYDEMRRIIREDEPARPSQRVSTLAAEARSTVADRRGFDERQLSKTLHGELDWIVMKALEKDRTRRYESAEALATDLQNYLDDQPVQACPPSVAYRLRKFAHRNRVPAGISALLTAMCLLIGLFGWAVYRGELRRADLAENIRRSEEQQRREQWARGIAIPQIERFVAEQHPVAAFRLVNEVQEVLPNDLRLNAFWEQHTQLAAFRVNPSGTRIFIREWDSSDADWIDIGRAPLTDVRLPIGELRWKLVQQGYATLEMQRAFPDLVATDYNLTRKSDTPQGMVAIPGGKVKTPPGVTVEVGRFYIDRFEVSNREYQQFVDAGGYLITRYWKHDFQQGGKVIPREVALASLLDQTGKHGPAGWSNGHFPVGEDDFPVRGISWYEAAAFAEFCGKALPTLHHWGRAASGNVKLIVPLSNFSGRGVAQVGSHSGIGWFGLYDMAGNVAEWCSNETEGGKRTLRGAAWNDPTYMFTDPNAAAPMARSETYGFRCVMYVDDPSAEQMASYLSTHVELSPATAEELQGYLTHFAYDRDAPLNATPQCVDCDPATEYRHDIVRIDAAYPAESFDVHLYLPRDAKPPYETVVYYPGTSPGPNAPRYYEPLSTKKHPDRCGLIQTGRAVCIPIYFGHYERGAPEDYEYSGSVLERTYHIRESQDLSRTVDYLQTRPDIDCERLIYFGNSRGSRVAPVRLIVEPRFRAAVLVSGGYGRIPLMREVESRRYAAHVKLPVLMINGINDAVFPAETSHLPMYRDLGSADKELRHIESGHNPPAVEIVKLADEWLRSRMGPGKGVITEDANDNDLRHR